MLNNKCIGNVDCDVGAHRATFCVEMTNNPPESNWLKFGQWVAACRVAQGYSQAELARRIGKNEQTVYRIEKGSPTKRPTVLKIAEALGQDEHDAVAIAFGLPEQPPDTRATRFNYSRTLAQIHDLLASVPPDKITEAAGRAGLTTKHAMQVMGHSQEKTFRRYLRKDAQVAAEIAVAMADERISSSKKA